MRKKIVVSIMLVTIIATGCGNVQSQVEAPDTEIEASTEQIAEAEPEPEKEAEAAEEETVTDGDNYVEVTLDPVPKKEIFYNENLVPSIEQYKVAEDFSNVEYEEEFAVYFEPDREYASENAKDLREALIKNNFAVEHGYSSEFFDVYEDNRYLMFPNFITVDSLMHTYHLYFAHLMKQVEKTYLTERVKSLTQNMMEASVNQYRELSGSDWEAAAFRNMEFFNIAERLQDIDSSSPINDAAFDRTTSAEYEKIMSCAGIDDCALNELMEDYSQYKPRGYYEGDEELEKYFRTMMWYGRIAFSFEKEDLIKSAILINLAIAEDSKDWKEIYYTTSFFAGASDDPGFDQVIGVIEKAYGKVPTIKELVDNKEAFDKCVEELKKLEAPKVNSIPVMEGENPIISSYRFMGQRFTIDAAIMQRLVYSAVEENAKGERRYLPDTLDVAAALGSETALKILEKNGDTEYKNYSENLFFSKEHFDNADKSLWDASLYSGWLNILRPLFEQKKDGYPSYMQSEEWSKKNLETFAGSFAELKHDTILYAKPVMAEMGGGDMEILDDRGYVDPQIVVYSRFISLSEKTKDGLEEKGMLGNTEKEDLEKLSEIAYRLLQISEKELTNQELTDEDYEFIRCYGGYIEHFWREANRNGDEVPLYSYEAPSPVIADIATDPNGSVLEVGTGNVDRVYVVFPIDGTLHIARGSAYSFYQFEMPISERLTDSEWRARLSGGYLDDDWNWVEIEKAPAQPEWTSSYRVGEK